MSGPAVGGILFTLPLAGALLKSERRGALSYAFTLAMLMGFLVLVGMIRISMAPVEKKAFSMKTVLAGLEYVWKTKLLLGSISLDLFAVLLGGATGAAADLCYRYSSCGATGFGVAAGYA